MNILITGGAGFIGGCLIRKLLTFKDFKIFNLDKLGYASDQTGIKQLFEKNIVSSSTKYKLINADLCNNKEIETIVDQIKPNLIMHLAAESHVDRSIRNPKTFIESNIIGTFNLLEASRIYFEKLIPSEKNNFRFHHISTDEVFGSLDTNGFFDENTSYDPRSPYSASKASSDHLVRAWHNTFNLPILLTNCSNNYGPWQFPEKLIPVVINKALDNKPIPVYGNGSNIRDWLFVEDHVDALLKVAMKGNIGETYCIGGNNEKTNLEIVKFICKNLDNKLNQDMSKLSLITFVEDRPGHDKRYAIDSTKINKELNWEPKFGFEKGIDITIDWYIENKSWCKKFID